jgi:outer membrane protein assembly factor BamB
MRARHVLLVSVILLAAAGCGISERVGELLAPAESNANEPSELVEFEPSVTVNELWSDRFGKGVDELYIKLVPAVNGDLIYTADRNGRIIAVRVENGAVEWAERDKRLRISGGPGTGTGLVFIGTSDAEVVARDGTTGELVWVASVSSEVLAPPIAARGIVVVQTGDGKLFGLHADSGKRRWVYDRSIPTLTLRGTATPVIHSGMVITGFDSGRMVALDLVSGKVVWETRLAIPSGRSDLERMVDLDSQPTIFDDTVYVAGFQGHVSALAVEDGKIEWTRDISSYAGLSVDQAHVYVSDESDTIWALDRLSGSSVWKQEALKWRHITAPAVFGDHVVVGDAQGYLHWLNRDTGNLANRTRIGRDRIITAPLNIGSAVLVSSSSGKLAAYRTE